MKKILALALVTGAVAAPVAFGHGDAHRSSAKVRMVDYVFKGVVQEVGTDSVTIERARGLSRFARRALDGATGFTVKLNGNTRIKSLHRWRWKNATLTAGDRVEILIRSPKGTKAADLPAAKFVVVRRHGAVVTPPSPPPVQQPPVQEPPAEPGTGSGSGSILL
jgi:hypothetical protein